MEITLIALGIAAFLCTISIFYSTLVFGISPMPTSLPVKKVILELLNKYKQGKTIYELGSGWGTLVSALSSELPAFHITGFERSPVPYVYSLIVNRITRRRNSRLKYKDFFGVSLAETDIVVCYLCTDLMTKLKHKIETDLRQGALVISSTFAVPGWEPIETVTAKDLYRSKVYVYRMGEQEKIPV